jgi:hypothetical protein
MFVGSDLEQPQIADRQETRYSERHVVNVSAPRVRFLNGPRSARIACVIARTAPKVKKKEQVESS